MKSAVVLWRQTSKKLRRKVKFKRRSDKVIIILFDYFGVVMFDPLQKWQDQYQLNQDDRLKVAKLCAQIDSNAISLKKFYTELGKLTGRTAQQTERDIQVYAEYNQDTLNIIRQLKKHSNIRIGLLSNAHGSLHQGIWKDGVHRLFDDVVTSQETAHLKPKPDPDFFLYAINRLGGRPAQAIFFDDLEINIQGAKTAGLRAYQFINAAACREQLIKLSILSDSPLKISLSI
jgi:HAD superfamily hydrolase (TIGR01509 family)